MKDNSFPLLAASNLGLAGVHGWLENLQPVVSVLVGLGQVAVAVVTVLYIIKQIRAKKTDANANTFDRTE